MHKVLFMDFWIWVAGEQREILFLFDPKIIIIYCYKFNNNIFIPRIHSLQIESLIIFWIYCCWTDPHGLSS